MLNLYQQRNCQLISQQLLVGPGPRKGPEAGKAGMILDEKQLLLTLTHFSPGLASTCLRSNFSDTFDTFPSFLLFTHQIMLNTYSMPGTDWCYTQENEYDTIRCSGVQVGESLMGACIRTWYLQWQGQTGNGGQAPTQYLKVQKPESWEEIPPSTAPLEPQKYSGGRPQLIGIGASHMQQMLNNFTWILRARPLADIH